MDKIEDIEKDLQLKFQGNTADNHIIPATVLADSIEALQKVIYILAMVHEGRDINERLRFSNEMASRYTVLCEIPEESSYAQFFHIGALKKDLISIEDISQVQSSFLTSLSFISNRDTDSLMSVVPESKLRISLINAFRSMVPKVGSGFSISVESAKSAQKTLLDERSALYLREISEKADHKIIRQTITGRLEKIDFGERKVTIIYAPTNRALSCTYDDGIEEMLLENRRELVQVTGIVTLDELDNPQRMTDVNLISYLDLSPFELSDFEINNQVFKFIQPISLDINLDDSEQLLLIEDESIMLNVFAQTREELWEELKEQIWVLWREYALENDNELSPPAIKLKQRLLNYIKVAPLIQEAANGA